VTVAIRCKDYSQLLQALNARRQALGMTMEVFDEKSGLTGGYSAKLFCGMRRFGEMSLPVVLQTLGVELMIAMPPTAPVEERLSCDSADRFAHRDTGPGEDLLPAALPPPLLAKPKPKPATPDGAARRAYFRERKRQLRADPVFREAERARRREHYAENRSQSQEIEP
jgi:hypothetical protein